MNGETRVLAIAKTGIATIACEMAGLQKVMNNLYEDKVNYTAAVDAILTSKGRVVVCGMGKSGIVGKKIAATLASTGTMSVFMHPGEGFHGDLGMVHPDDVFLALSNSGETDEVLKLIPFLADNGNTVISITKSHDNSLAKAANISLRAGVDREACPHQLAPTSSTTAAMALGDALAVSLIHERKFKPEDFARFHPGGSLGRKLLCKVRDVMRTENLPFVSPGRSIIDAMVDMTDGRLGMLLVGTDDNVLGVISDGDLRRHIQMEGHHFIDFNCSQLMIEDYHTVGPDVSFAKAVEMMEERSITKLVVVDNGIVVGIVKK